MGKDQRWVAKRPQDIFDKTTVRTTRQQTEWLKQRGLWMRQNVAGSKGSISDVVRALIDKAMLEEMKQ